MSIIGQKLTKSAWLNHLRCSFARFPLGFSRVWTAGQILQSAAMAERSILAVMLDFIFGFSFPKWVHGHLQQHKLLSAGRVFCTLQGLMNPIFSHFCINGTLKKFSRTHTSAFLQVGKVSNEFARRFVFIAYRAMLNMSKAVILDRVSHLSLFHSPFQWITWI